MSTRRRSAKKAVVEKDYEIRVDKCTEPDYRMFNNIAFYVGYDAMLYESPFINQPSVWYAIQSFPTTSHYPLTNIGLKNRSNLMTKFQEYFYPTLFKLSQDYVVFSNKESLLPSETTLFTYYIQGYPCFTRFNRAMDFVLEQILHFVGGNTKSCFLSYMSISEFFSKHPNVDKLVSEFMLEFKQWMNRSLKYPYSAYDSEYRHSNRLLEANNYKFALYLVTYFLKDLVVEFPSVVIALNNFNYRSQQTRGNEYEYYDSDDDDEYYDDEYDDDYYEDDDD